MRAPTVQDFAGCLICGALPVVAVGMMIPLGDADYSDLMRLREAPIGEHETPALCYGLCRVHLQTPTQSTAQVEAIIRDAARQVVVQ